MTLDTYAILSVKQQVGITPLAGSTWDDILNGRQLETYLLSNDTHAVLNYPATGKFTIPVGYDVKINTAMVTPTTPATIIAWDKKIKRR